MERVPREKKNNDSANSRSNGQGALALAPRQNDISAGIDNSPLMVSQRQKLQRLFGPAAQLQGDEEEPLQGMFETTQLVRDMTVIGAVTQPKSAGTGIVQCINEELVSYLSGLGYTKDRNYCSFKGKTPIGHVGWKAHAGAAVNEGLGIAKAVSFLRTQKIAHKFDINDNDKKALDKFLTVYPPTKESDWKKVIHELETIMSAFSGVEIEGNMRVKSDSAVTAQNPLGIGKVYMRHGQLTALTLDKVSDLVQENGTLGKYKRYKGKAINSTLPLLSYEKNLFFSQSNAEPPSLTPDHIYMAILYSDSIIPDTRTEANPAKAPLPSGVSEYNEEEAFSSMIGSPPEELGFLARTSDDEDYTFGTEPFVQLKSLSPVHKKKSEAVVQCLTSKQKITLQSFRKALQVSAAAALKALSQSATMRDFRAVVSELAPVEVNDLIQKSMSSSGMGLSKEVLPYAEWLGEVRNELIASNAEALKGKLNWVTSGASESDNKVVPKLTGKDKTGSEQTNTFTSWLRGKGPPPKDNSNMNCWEACLYAGFKAGVLNPWILFNIYEIAKEAGQEKFDNKEGGSVIVAAYANGVAAVLGAGEESWAEGDAAPPRGYLIFFNGPSHVAVSRGFLDEKDHTPAVMSLWSLPGPYPVMQATTIGEIFKANKEYKITYGPAPM